MLTLKHPITWALMLVLTISGTLSAQKTALDSYIREAWETNPGLNQQRFQRQKADIALDEARPRPRASVLVRHRCDAVDENAVRALVAGAVQDMTPEDVAVVQVQANVEVPAREANLVRFGPIAVTRGTAGALKGVLAGALGLHLVLAVLVVIGWRRRKLSVPEAPAT